MTRQKLSQTLKITLALMLSVATSGILQAAPAYATVALEPEPVTQELHETPPPVEALNSQDVVDEATATTPQTNLTATGTPTNPCSANYFPKEQMWEITWGRQFSDTNGVPTFTMSSNGGLVSLNGGTVPDYMKNNAQWRWLYVTVANVQNGRTVTYGFADGTVRTAVVSADTNNCPAVVWTETPPPAPTRCPAVLSVNHSTNVATNGWVLPADAEYVDGGVKLNVSGTNPDASWDETYIERSFVGQLADIGTSVDFTANPNQYAGIHIVTSKGVLVYEKEASYGGKWWSSSNFGVASGMGYATFDTLENIVAANPGVTTSLLRVLYTSPVAGSSTVNTVTVGCTVYTFSKAVIPPVVPPTTPTPGEVLGDKTEVHSTPQTLGTQLPTQLPATGANGSHIHPLLIIISSLAAYGATYFIQGRRTLNRAEN